LTWQIFIALWQADTHIYRWRLPRSIQFSQLVSHYYKLMIAFTRSNCISLLNIKLMPTEIIIATLLNSPSILIKRQTHQANRNHSGICRTQQYQLTQYTRVKTLNKG